MVGPGVARAASGAQFEHLPQQHEHGDHRRRFRVDADLTVMLEGGGEKAGRKHHTAL